MSKNYELIQQAGFTIGSTTDFVTEEKATSVGKETRGTSAALSSTEPTVRHEASRLVQSLFLNPERSSQKAVLFAAIDENGGCESLSALTARLLAQSTPASVCIVDGNLRSPSLPAAFGIDPDRGLADALRQSGNMREFAKRVGPENLWLLSSGSAAQDDALLLSSDRMTERVRELRREFDYVIVNAPSLGSCGDAFALGRLLDGVVLVVEANSTRREAALRTVENLRSANIPVLGAVLNNRTFPIPSAVYKRI